MDIITTATKAVNAYGAAKSIVDNVQDIFGLKGNTKSLGNAPGATDMNAFMSTMRTKGVARKNYFHTFIGVPEMLGGAQNSNLNIHLYAENLNLPGVNFATSDIRRYGTGALEKKPYAPIFNDVTINFIVDGKGDVYKFFYKWMKGMINFDDPSGASTGVSSLGGLAPYEVNFKDDYAVDLNVVTFNEQKDEILSLKLYDAYPISISDTPLGWGDVDSFMSLAVTFTYYNIGLSNIDTTTITRPGISSPLSALEKLFKVGSAIQVLGALKKPTSIGDVVNVVGNAKIAIGGLKGLFP